MKTNFLNLAGKAMCLLVLLAVLGSAVNPVLAMRNSTADGSVLPAIAINDDFNNAKLISAYPFRRSVTNFEATEALDDPTATRCNLAPGLATVWYKYTPSAKVMVHLDTIGSSYDTFLAVWRGKRGNLVEVACNDDASAATFASAINITLSAGVTYYIEVAQFNGNLTDVGEGSAKFVEDEADVKAAGATHAFRLVQVVSRKVKSNGTHDGYVVESRETSGVGLLKDATLPYIRLGDDEKKRQYIGILSYNTGGLPNSAVVISAVIKVKQSGISSNVFTKLGNIKLDIRKPYFGTGLGLEKADFNAAASRSLIGTFRSTPVSGWYTANLRNTSFSSVNLTGYTQFRLMFARDDSNDTIGDYLRIYSGNAATANRPILIVRYYIP